MAKDGKLFFYSNNFYNIYLYIIMDLYGINNAIQTSNDYIKGFNDNVSKINDLNDAMQLQRERDSSSLKEMTDVDIAKDAITNAVSGYGFGNSAKNWSKFSKAQKLANISSDISDAIKTASKQPEIEKGRQIAIQSGLVRGEDGVWRKPEGQPAQAPEQRVEEVQEPEPQQEQVEQSAKEDETLEVEPAEISKPEEEAESKSLVSKALNITDETAETIGKVGGGLAGVANIATGITSDLHGGWGRMNTAEKIGNVGGIVGGSAEALGTALDMTGVGAVVGVPLQVLGGLTSLVSGLFTGGGDIVKDEAQKKKVDDQASKPEIQTPVISASAVQKGNVPQIVTQ